MSCCILPNNDVVDFSSNARWLGLSIGHVAADSFAKRSNARGRTCRSLAPRGVICAQKQEKAQQELQAARSAAASAIGEVATMAAELRNLQADLAAKKVLCPPAHSQLIASASRRATCPVGTRHVARGMELTCS